MERPRVLGARLGDNPNSSSTAIGYVILALFWIPTSFLVNLVLGIVGAGLLRGHRGRMED